MLEQKNRDGDWFPAIPVAFESWLKYLCPECGETFWTDGGYRGHYALFHILKLD